MIEARRYPVLGPNSKALRGLTEAQFTEPKDLVKPGGQRIRTRLVMDGSGMAGLSDRKENQEWSGIFNHIQGVSTVFLTIGALLRYNGHDIDLQKGLDTITLSHFGRRQFDEAGWYTSEIPDAQRRLELRDTGITLELLHQMNFDPDLIEHVAVHSANPADIINNQGWNKNLPIFLDFRITQGAVSLEERFEQLKARLSNDYIIPVSEWAHRTQAMLFADLRLASYDELAQNPDHLRARVHTARKLGKFSVSEEIVIRESRICGVWKLERERGRNAPIEGDLAEILGLSQEELLGRLQLFQEDINDRLLVPERGERYIRRLYINDAEEEIFDRISQLQGDADTFEKEFPQNTWWGKYTRDLYARRNGVPLLPQSNKKKGIARATDFYTKIEECR